MGLKYAVLAAVAVGLCSALPPDSVAGVTTRVSVASDGTQAHYYGQTDPSPISISGDGRYVAFASVADNLVPGDTNQTGDAFVHDRQTGRTERVSAGSDGTQGNEDTRKRNEMEFSKEIQHTVLVCRYGKLRFEWT